MRLLILLLVASLLAFAGNTPLPPPSGNQQYGVDVVKGAIENQIKMQEEVNEKGVEELKKVTKQLLTVAGGGKKPLLKIYKSDGKVIAFSIDPATGNLVEVEYTPSKTKVSPENLEPKKVSLNNVSSMRPWVKLGAAVIYIFGVTILIFESGMNFYQRRYIAGAVEFFLVIIASYLMYQIYVSI
jgi:hypothetical protein